jgi:hypothetical protein
LVEKDEFELLQDSWLKIWQMYMAWFAWHVGFQLLGFGGVYSVKELRPNYWAVVIFMSVFGVTSFGASVLMTYYDVCTRRHAIALRKDKAPLIFGKGIALYADIATTITNLMILVGWVFVWFHPPQSN